MKVDERGFEDAIETALLESGFLKSVPSHFDPVLGLDTAELFAFIGATQVKDWERLLGRYGNDPGTAQHGFAKRLAAELDNRGTVDVLRHGVVDLGVTVQLAYFKPAHGLTPELERLYEANRVSVTRQLAFEPESNKTLDMALLVNGIPTATAELKNPLTGQDVEEAITPVPHRPRPRQRDSGTPSSGAFRRGPRPGRHDDQARWASDPVPAVQSGPRRRRRQPAEPRRATARPICGSGCGPGTPGWTSSRGSSSRAAT